MPDLTVKDVTNMLQDQLVMVSALHAIAADSEDAETVRTAAAALMNTQAGRNFVAINPINI